MSVPGENAPGLVDMHTHTTCSDGELTPRQLLNYAAQKGLGAMAITDHDTVSAYSDQSLSEYAHTVGVELVSGVEISTVADEFRVHVLGLGIDTASERLLQFLESLRQQRNRQATLSIRRLNDHGWQLDADSLLQTAVITKAHIADSVINEPANATKLQARFAGMPTRGRFIEAIMNAGQECYVPSSHRPSEEVVAVIHQAGGLAILAHPVAYLYEQAMPAAEAVAIAKRSGCDGIEAIYYYYHKSGTDQELDHTQEFIDLACSNGLLISGGSDFHGQGQAIGNYTDLGYGEQAVLPNADTLAALMQALQK